MEGSDMLRIGIWDGLRLVKMYAWAKSDGKEIWENMKRLADEHKVPGRNIVFDANGVGNFLTGFFRSSFDFRSQATPLEETGVKVDYQNLRTQCVFRLAKLVAEHEIFIDCQNQMERDTITEEFEAHKKTGQTATGKLTITPKEEIKAAIRRSPDYFDMILMRMVFEIKPRKGSYLSQKLPGVKYD
jgi:hypothetical protein